MPGWRELRQMPHLVVARYAPRVLTSFQSNFNLDNAETAELFRLKTNTVRDWKTYSIGTRRMRSVNAKRLLELARIQMFAQVLVPKGELPKWFKNPLSAFGCRTPKEIIIDGDADLLIASMTKEADL